MKNSHNISKVLLLISIYCFGIFAASATAPNKPVYSIELSEDHAEFLDYGTQLHFIHTQQSETILSTVADYGLLEVKLSFKDFAKAIIPFNIVIHSKYKQYVNALKTVDIRYRKSDIIFPFHNFW